MEVRRFLAAKNPVVLEREYSEGIERLVERLSDSLGGADYGAALLVRKIEQRRDMPTRDDAALPDFELPRINHGQCMFAFVDDLPSFFANRDAKVARISYGKFDHCPLRSRWQVDAKKSGSAERGWSKRLPMEIRSGEALVRTLPPTPMTGAAWPAQHWKTRMAGTTAVGLDAKSGLATRRADSTLLNLVFEPF